MSVENTEVPVQVVPEKSNGCLKVFLYLLAFLGLCSCCCCFGLFGMSGYMSYAIQNSITTDSAKIVQLTDDYVGKVDIPEGFAPKMGIDLKFPLFSSKIVVASCYASGDDSLLIFGSFLMNLPQETIMELKTEAAKSFTKQQTEYTVLEEKTIQVEIAGKEFPFIISKVKDEKGTELLQAVGTFETAKSSTAFAFLILNPEKYNEQTAIDILKSIK